MLWFCSVVRFLPRSIFAFSVMLLACVLLGSFVDFLMAVFLIASARDFESVLFGTSE